MATSRRPSPTRVFVDASVLFPASLSPTGSARELIVAGVFGRVSLVLSPFVVEETRRNLSRKAPPALPFFEAFLARGVVHVVDPPAALVRRVAEEIEPKDAPIVAGAVHAEVRFLATYDRKHLLAHAALIRVTFGIAVETPEAILASL